MNKKEILGQWVHAHERDNASAKVFVPAQESLPLSRGRQRLEFLPDGTFVEGMPGADDRAVKASGTYQFDGKQLLLQRAGSTEQTAFEAMAGSDGISLNLKMI